LSAIQPEDTKRTIFIQDFLLAVLLQLQPLSTANKPRLIV